jgi:TolB-like protein
LAARDRSRPAAPVAEQAATAHPAKSVPDLSIVVLPFANLSNDPAQDYFADGITQNLTNDLSRIDGLFIISPNTAFAWKGKAVDARQIGKELGVRYVLKGSVQRDQSRVRVTAQTDQRCDRRPSVGRHLRKADHKVWRSIPPIFVAAPPIHFIPDRSQRQRPPALVDGLRPPANARSSSAE